MYVIHNDYWLLHLKYGVTYKSSPAYETVCRGLLVRSRRVQARSHSQLLSFCTHYTTRTPPPPSLRSPQTDATCWSGLSHAFERTAANTPFSIRVSGFVGAEHERREEAHRGRLRPDGQLPRGAPGKPGGNRSCSELLTTLQAAENSNFEILAILLFSKSKHFYPLNVIGKRAGVHQEQEPDALQRHRQRHGRG